MRVLVVGQTPPPYGGQTLMIERLVRARFTRVVVHHVRLAFARDMSDMGRFRVGKALHALSVLARIVAARFRHRIDVLYYPPSGSSRRAMLRDCALLIPTRWLFPKTVFHFHAAGLSELYERLSGPERLLFRLAFDSPDLAIVLSPSNPPDDRVVRARRVVVIANGIEDAAEATPERRRGARPVVLFVGVLQESKGLRVLLEAARKLADEALDFELVVVGGWKDERFRAEMENLVAASTLRGRVTFTGVRAGDCRFAEFARADIFCFPSYFESESFGLVVLEAMVFSLPVLTTRWRGLPDLVVDGETGLLVPVRDVDATAAGLRALLLDEALRRRLGAAGRRRFLERFSLHAHLEAMETALLSLSEEPSEP